MFGSKTAKQDRLLVLVETIVRQGPLTAGALATRLGLERSTVYRDLVVLEDRGIYLCEDDGGQLTLAEDVCLGDVTLPIRFKRPAHQHQRAA